VKKETIFIVPAELLRKHADFWRKDCGEMWRTL